MHFQKVSALNVIFKDPIAVIQTAFEDKPDLIFSHTNTLWHKHLSSITMW